MAAKFSGIINGIDVSSWDAARDAALPCPYGPGALAGKALCKRYLQLGLGMAVDPDRPLVAVISRLVPQKGIHLMEAAMHAVAALGGQFVLLGTGHADGALRAAKAGPLAQNADVQCLFLYSETLSHLLYAAADMFLVPSIFEPCGLTQLIALRCGVTQRPTRGLALVIRNRGVPPSHHTPLKHIPSFPSSTTTDTERCPLCGPRAVWAIPSRTWTQTGCVCVL